jgi:hypothetical protein
MSGRSNLGGLTNLTVDHDGVSVTLTMSGPAGAWFAVGFDAQAMSDRPSAVVVDGEGKVAEHKLGNHDPGSVLKPSIAVVSSAVSSAGVRTVVMTRPVVGKTPDHYTFPTTAGSVPVITAIGSTPQLSYHKARTGATITLLPKQTPSCVCASQSTAYLTYMKGNASLQSTQAFHYSCLDEPRSDMLRHGDGTGRALPNAACQAETYHGGLRCCQHHFF